MTLISPSLKGVFPKVLLPFYGNVSLGNMTMYKVYLSRLPDGFTFVGIERKGCYPFKGYVHASYAAEKLNLYDSDAKNFADFLNCQLGHTGETGQGTYDEQYCENQFDEDE